MAHPNEVQVRESFAAFERGDVDALRSKFFAEDVRYHVPGKGSLRPVITKAWIKFSGSSGRSSSCRGATSVLSCTVFLPMTSTPWRFIPPAPNGRASILEENIVLVFHIRGGKATEVWAQFTDLYAVDEFWS